MEAWEELDVDDSDLPSLLKPPSLRPCGNISSSRSAPISRLSQPNVPVISQVPRPLSQAPFSSTFPFESPAKSLGFNPDKEKYPVEEENCLKNKDTIRPKIPGPASVIQAANRRKQMRQDFRLDDTCLTQNSFRRMQEDGNEDDEDFKQYSWLSAMRFLGWEDGFSERSGIGAIKRSLSTNRVPLVVGIIKTCKPNGLGDLVVTLKDPSGTISGAIHHKIITESEFGKDLLVGSVVILHKVVAFAISCSACYLNITLNNMVKVISRKDDLSPRQGLSSFAVRFTTTEAVHITEGQEKDTVTMDVGSVPIQGACPISSNQRHPDTSRIISESTRINMDDRRTSKESSQRDDSWRTSIQEQEENLPRSSNLTNSNKKCPHQGSLEKNFIEVKSSTVNEIKDKKVRITEFTNAKWTDEQLNELLVGFEDDPNFL